ncbi:phospholipid scramblase 1-like [Ochotona curzoniae]|uniref:phospholipid scramblase 1-like n=1 Tax=Ochotona curzoniae TaxID=130825 RepID=UPI001B3521F6|nr:phospholipid scramblase 1-like [Ochotona curzoniae]
MQAPARPLNCPPGLEYLMQIDQVLVHQEVSVVEALTDFQSKNRYEIKNRLGQRLFLAVEDSECCSRNCWDALRPFTMRILDNTGREVITMERPLKCTCCCSPCCLQKLEIQAPRGVPIGYVAQIWHPFLPKFKIQNEKKEDVLKISGPFFVCNCGGDVDFHVKSLDETSVVGRVSKQWSGCVKEVLTDADNYEIQFPLDLDVKLKAVLLGACLLIDFMFFENCAGMQPVIGVW